MIKKIAANWKSGLTVALVSLPLSISLAVASYVSPVQGIITGIWAGLVASLFGSSNFNIIGPTGALSGIIATFVLTQGVESVSMLAIMAGLIILLAYVLHFERYLIFIPSSVIHGFTMGVAFIIGLNQLNFALGLKNLPLHREFIHNVVESLSHVWYAHIETLLIFSSFFIALSIMRIWLPTLPGAILLSPMAIVLGYAVDRAYIPLELETLGSKFGTMSGMLFQFPLFCFSQQLMASALVVAFIAILETMLSAKIADAITKTKHNSRQEMFGLGLANIVSGIMGGIPATAALARTALNISSGATDRMSAALSSFFMAISSLIFLTCFQFMPMAVIAAILVNVAINMVELEHFGRFFAHDKVNFFIAILVAGITVYKDPIIGILVGASLSLLFFIEKISQGHYELTYAPAAVAEDQMKQAIEAQILIYSFKGKLAYINSQSYIASFETHVNHYKHIILNLHDIYFVDIDGIDSLDEIIEFLNKKNKKVVISGVHAQIKGLLKAISKKYQELESQGLVFDSAEQAIHYFE
jgi:sulfate permease, SulP family